MSWVVTRSAEIAAPEVAATLPDLTLVSDAEVEPVVEVMIPTDGVATSESWNWLVNAMEHRLGPDIDVLLDMFFISKSSKWTNLWTSSRSPTGETGVG